MRRSCLCPAVISILTSKQSVNNLLTTSALDFKNASDLLGLTAVELAHELETSLEVSVSPAWVRQARLDPEAGGYRAPPPGWEAVVARLARGRRGDLDKMAEELERAAGEG
jgi:hypothetical protein